MQYLYTNNPDKLCHKHKGAWGRPVNTCDIDDLLAKGWVRNADKLPKESNSEEEAKEATQEESVLSRDELAVSLGINLLDADGKKLHYKLIDSAIKEAQANEHHES